VSHSKSPAAAVRSSRAASQWDARYAVASTVAEYSGVDGPVAELGDGLALGANASLNARLRLAARRFHRSYQGSRAALLAWSVPGA
jgi:hypothetical protein